MDAANDNAPPARPRRVGNAPRSDRGPHGAVRIVGRVGEGGRVTFTDPDWRPQPRPAPQLLTGDPDREA